MDHFFPEDDETVMSNPTDMMISRTLCTLDETEMSNLMTDMNQAS